MEDYNPIISFIIPLYNSEKYIKGALDSILMSDLKISDYEIVVVNDGSTDNGPNIVRNYVESYDNVRMVSQENQGLGGARNTGIHYANGLYFWCVDADDVVDKELSLIMNCLKDHPELDILAVTEMKVTENLKPISLHCFHTSVPYETVISGVDAVVHGYSPSSACALIVRRQFVLDTEVFFVPHIAHQDVEWTYRLFPLAKNVYFSHITPYYYIYRKDSISRSIKPEKKLKYILDDIYIIKSFRGLSEKYKGVNDELYATIKQRERNTHFGLVLSTYTKRKFLDNLGILKPILNELKRSDLIPLKGSFGSIKKNIAKYYINFWVRMYNN